MPGLMKTSVMVATVTATDPIIMDRYADPGAVTYVVLLAGGGDRTYDVEFTIKNPNEETVTAADWRDVVSAQTASRDGSITFPMGAMRLNITAGSGSATATLFVVQHSV